MWNARREGWQCGRKKGWKPLMPHATFCLGWKMPSDVGRRDTREGEIPRDWRCITQDDVYIRKITVYQHPEMKGWHILLCPLSVSDRFENVLFPDFFFFRCIHWGKGYFHQINIYLSKKGNSSGLIQHTAKKACSNSIIDSFQGPH